MSDMKKFLDYEGVQHLWSKVNMNDYPNNAILMGVINAIDETKADRSELVQSDWNQNDETAADYIKNRTHYDNTVTTSIVLADEEIVLAMFSDIMPEGCWSEPITLENGKTYTVTVDDVKRDIICENDELIFVNAPETEDTLTIKSEVILGEKEWTYRIKIEVIEVSVTLKQLDEKFIPDTIARVEDIPEINYPVTSVNGKTGEVQLVASDVGAIALDGETNQLTFNSHITINSQDTNGTVSFWAAGSEDDLSEALYLDTTSGNDLRINGVYRVVDNYDVANKKYVDDTVAPAVYKDVTADFEGTDFNSVWEYLLSLTTAGKYCCKDQRSICYSDIVVDPTNSSIFNTITCHYNDGSKYIHFCLNNQEVSYVEISASGEIYAPAFSTGIIDYVNEAIANVTPTDITEEVLTLLESTPEYLSGLSTGAPTFWLAVQLLLNHTPGEYTALNGAMHAEIYDDTEYLQTKGLKMRLETFNIEILSNGYYGHPSGSVRFINGAQIEHVENFGYTDETVHQLRYKLDGLDAPSNIGGDFQATNKKYVDDAVAPAVYKDVTADFEGTDFGSALEYLASLTNAGKYCCKGNYNICYSDIVIDPTNSSIFNTITCYCDDGYKIIYNYLNNQQISSVDIQSDGAFYMPKLLMSTIPTDKHDVANKKYVDDTIEAKVQSKSQVQIITWEDDD